MTRKKTIHLGANLHAVGSHAAAWRWPASDSNAFMHVDHYIEYAQVAERGLMDAVFLADRLGVSVNLASRPPHASLEPIALLTAIARATQYIGLIATASTTYNEPFNVARGLMSLDIISGGRAAWNVVTSSDATNLPSFGGPPVGREERYKRAEAFVEVVKQLWLSWGERVIIADKETGVFGDPSKLKLLDPETNMFGVRGPLSLPPSPQGYPVIFQAGGSAQGVRLAVLHADAIFAAANDLDAAISEAADVRTHSDEAGRSRAPLIMPGLITTLAGTEAEARRRKRELDDLLDWTGALEGFSRRTSIALEHLKLDQPIDPDHLPKDRDSVASIGSYRAIEGLIRKGMTVREILSEGQVGGHRVIAGTPEQVADSIAEWFRSGAVDGLNIMPDVLCDGLPAFVDEVIPLLQKKGIYRTEYEETTLRARLNCNLNL